MIEAPELRVPACECGAGELDDGVANPAAMRVVDELEEALVAATALDGDAADAIAYGRHPHARAASFTQDRG
ncbi:hypothetical protein RZS08_37245, partial [Arthrospira platensis SPKY1]|nr:hypothetical protein [Arthrospira platensis SPKY1]